MTPEEAIAYIENYTWSTTRLGLDRTRKLLAALDNPQRKLKFIHVAGSNGKGSTCAMLAAILRKAGYRTGLYTSPYIQDFCERIQIDGENIPGKTLAALTERVQAAADAMEDHPSQFELVTAIAMEYYAQQKCDIVVLEVGMGGALDSTNVIDCPEVAVITNIGLEHTEYLGDTLEKIAATKAGIIKPGCRAVCYDGAPEVTAVVGGVCSKLQVPLHRVDGSKLTVRSSDLSGQDFIYNGAQYHLALLGRHQLYNAATVIETVDAMRRRGWSIPEQAVKDGFAQVTWPARLEIMSRQPLVLLDGGHNPQCAAALADSVHTLLLGKRVVALLGVLRDKDYPQMMDLIMPLAQEFICLTPLSGRALPAGELAQYLEQRGAVARAYEEIEAGLSAALDAAGEDGAVVAFGSLYLVGALRGAFHKVYRDWIRKTKVVARRTLDVTTQKSASQKVVEEVLALPEFKRAKTVLLYRAVGGEVQLDLPPVDGKRYVYPKCVSQTELAAVAPQDPEAWESGAFGILEPVLERSAQVAPEDIDLVLCPCTAFDKTGGRLGMGAGYYDRFLPKCKNAVVCAVAFECQKVSDVPRETWDVSMDFVVTEQTVYRVK